MVSMWTGVPVMQIAEAESERLLNMEEELRTAIIGQEEAIQAISKAVRRGPRRAQGSQAPDRLLHVPRTHRRRQDRADQGAGAASCSAAKTP